MPSTNLRTMAYFRTVWRAAKLRNVDKGTTKVRMGYPGYGRMSLISCSNFMRASCSLRAESSTAFLKASTW